MAGRTRPKSNILDCSAPHFLNPYGTILVEYCRIGWHCRCVVASNGWPNTREVAERPLPGQSEARWHSNRKYYSGDFPCLDHYWVRIKCQSNRFCTTDSYVFAGPISVSRGVSFGRPVNVALRTPRKTLPATQSRQPDCTQNNLPPTLIPIWRNAPVPGGANCSNVSRVYCRRG